MNSDPANSANSAASLQLDELTVRAGGQRLLRKTSVAFAPGKITLIIGASGAGKSTLLRILAGLIDTAGAIQVEGKVRLDDEAKKPNELQGKVGVVFQNHALFDELSARENVTFAESHRAGRLKDRSLTTDSLLKELGVPINTPTSSLSGGQRQRLAIARTLAYDPDIVLYDEPTTGLDHVTARRVSKLIQNTHENHGKTSIIVTHDYDNLAPIADEIFLLDTTTQSLAPVRKELWPDLGDMLSPREETKSKPQTKASQLTDTIVSQAGGFFESTTRVAEKLAMAPLALAPIWRSPFWGFRYLIHYLLVVAGPSAIIYLAIAGAIVGFVTTYFTFKFLPYAHLTHDLLLENLLTAIGFLMYRVLVPMMATVLIAARSGAAVASDIGGKVYGRQADALKTLGGAPQRYWLTGTLWAFLIGTPFLTFVCYFVAAAVSLVVFSYTHPQQGPDYWNLYFHWGLAVPDQWTFRGFYWLLAKMLVCALGIGLIAYHVGSLPKQSSNDVSRGVTSTILWSTLFVLATHFAFAFYEFEATNAAGG